MILFIHGLIGHMRAAEVSERFGESALAPDLLGYGEQSGYAGEISLSAQVEFLHALCADRHLQGVHVVGQSVGGAIAMLFARQYPELVAHVVSVEGNFTLKDAFWSKRIAESTIDDVAAGLEADRNDPAAWLAREGVAPTPERVAAATSHLLYQSPTTVHAMAKSVVEITAKPKYLDDVMTVINNGTPVRLIAGERSAPQWDVPPFVRDCAEMALLPATGHLMTIESPRAFADAVARFCA